MQNSKLSAQGRPAFGWKTQNEESGKTNRSGVWLVVLLVCGLVGFTDASYLTVEHFRDVPPPCQINWVTQILGPWVDCGRVLTSKWASVGPVPTAALGMVFYGGILGWALIEIIGKSIQVEKYRSIKGTENMKGNWLYRNLKLVTEIRKRKLVGGVSMGEFVESGRWYQLLGVMAGAGLVTSGVLVYLMLFVIGSVCLYCMLSAVNTVVIAYVTYRIKSVS